MTEPEYGSFSDETKKHAYQRIVAHLDSVSFSVLSYYPNAEVESWTIQLAEAQAIIAAGEDADIEMAPFLTNVCKAHYQTEDEEELLTHLKTKSALVLNNAATWAYLAAWINGTRARYQELMEAAITSDQVLYVLHQGFAEIDQFKMDNNL